MRIRKSGRLICLKPARLKVLAFIVCLASAFLGIAFAETPESWVPARWDGGPLEVARRMPDKALSDPSIRQAITEWYQPETLGLLEGSPINCLLLTFSTGADEELERKQQKMVAEYARAAKQRGITVLGLVYPGADPSKVVAEVSAAGLEGIVLDGDFPGDAPRNFQNALQAAKSAAVVIPIAQNVTSARLAQVPIHAVRGDWPDILNLAEMGIRAGPSGEPWILSNGWLVRSFRLTPEWRPIWVSEPAEAGPVSAYLRTVGDAALAGARWIVTIDDGFRVKLRSREPDALAAWRRINAFIKFSEDHQEWRSFTPYGNLGIVLDAASADPDNTNEYLNLVARRQIPYRLIARSQLTEQSLAGFQAILAADLAPPTDAERKLLRAFAERGGLVVAAPSWGDATKGEGYAEIPLGKGRVVVYKDNPPDPEAVARDLRDLLSPEETGVNAFNVPSVLTYASAGDSDKRLLVQLLNYSSYPAEAITIRVNGKFKTARLYMPEEELANLTLKIVGARTEALIPKLPIWGGVLFE